jgi:hypothetical protein
MGFGDLVAKIIIIHILGNLNNRYRDEDTCRKLIDYILTLEINGKSIRNKAYDDQLKEKWN